MRSAPSRSRLPENEMYMCVVVCVGAGNCLIEGQEHSEHEEHDEVLVGDAELDAHPERERSCRPGLGLFLDALVAVLEADEQHDDGNDGVEDETSIHACWVSRRRVTSGR